MKARSIAKQLKWISAFIPGLICPGKIIAQSAFKGVQNLFTEPKHYFVNYVSRPPLIDGNIADSVWQKAAWTSDFEDIEGDIKPKPPLQTRVKMLWGDSCIYIAAEITDPHVWATLTHHDDIIFRDNDFEVFIDPNNTTHQYFEIEYNALNTVFDLFLNKPYRNGGSAMIAWDANDLKSAVKVKGTLNNPSDVDKSWTIEMAIPYKAISIGNTVQIPKEGSMWRINFSRVEWDTQIVDGKYIKLKDSAGNNLPEHNWVWSPQGVVNMHYPERWGYLIFKKQAEDNAAFKLPESEEQKKYLWLIYYREKQWFEKHKVYTSSLKELGLAEIINVNGKTYLLKLEASSHQFMAFVNSNSNKMPVSINQEGLVK